MNLEIRNEPLDFELYGFGSVAPQKDYVETAFRLMGNMWETVKSNTLKNKGLNIWVYESGDRVFAGVELTETPPLDTGLEKKTLHLSQYAYFKHIGPYSLIKQTCQRIREELAAKGYTLESPYLEVYGHWTEDESKLETELIWGVGS